MAMWILAQREERLVELESGASIRLIVAGGGERGYIFAEWPRIGTNRNLTGGDLPVGLARQEFEALCRRLNAYRLYAGEEPGAPPSSPRSGSEAPKVRQDLEKGLEVIGALRALREEGGTPGSPSDALPLAGSREPEAVELHGSPFDGVTCDLAPDHVTEIMEPFRNWDWPARLLVKRGGQEGYYTFGVPPRRQGRFHAISISREEFYRNPQPGEMGYGLKHPVRIEILCRE